MLKDLANYTWFQGTFLYVNPELEKERRSFCWWKNYSTCVVERWSVSHWQYKWPYSAIPRKMEIIHRDVFSLIVQP